MEKANSAPSDSIMTVGEINAASAMMSHISANQLDLTLTNVARELEPFVKLLEPLLQLLDVLVQDFNSDGPLIQRYCTCLLTILKLMGKISFKQFMKRRQLDYLKLCNLFKSLRAVYDPDWSIMQLTSHAILEYPIDEISRDIKLRGEGQPINRQLGSYINLIVDFITHPTLQLESFSERKRAYIVRVFGDLRLKFVDQLIRFWKDLNRSIICDLIPTCIQSFLDVTLLPNDELQQKLMPFFWDILDAEDKFRSNLRQMERCLVDNLDLFMNLDRGNGRFVENFDHILRRLMRERSPSWEARGLKLVGSVTRLMQLLLNYRQSLEMHDNGSKQMSCLVDLLSFYKDQERMDIYLKYLFKLCDMHLEMGNHTEAALTLKLYADELRWCNRSLGPLEDFKGIKFPEEQEWARKEKLYHKIVHYFDLGKCWEESIGLCKELASFYENYLVDYEKVSGILKRLAQFLDYILEEHRPEREYFRVEFLGASLPEFVRNREFIYRGGEYERLASFIQRLTAEFPGAQVLNSKSKQSIGKAAADSGSYLVVSNVRPVPFLQDHFKSGQRIINDKIIQYYLNNRLDTFSYDLPIVKTGANAGASANNNNNNSELNVKNLWVGRYMLKTRKQLPDILPWNEVISQEYIEISPVNNAIETISGMNLELSKLILGYTKEPNKPISPLTMRLQGVIEAAVNGGPAVIVNAFFKRPPAASSTSADKEDEATSSQEESSASSSSSSAVAAQQPVEPEALYKLRDLFKQQYSILETGLALHAKLAPAEVMPLHDRLVERLPSIREVLLEDTNQIVDNNYEIPSLIVGSKAADHSAATSTSTTSTTTTTTTTTGEPSTGATHSPPPPPPPPASLKPTLSGAFDELDGPGHDLNGNLFVVPERRAPDDTLPMDQIYSQPSETSCQLASHRQQPPAAPANGTRSQISSPSRYNSCTSSSLSTLAVLSNLPVNRSRLSITPSKEVVQAYRDSAATLTSANESCARAARRLLTYDSDRLSLDLSKSSSASASASSSCPSSAPGQTANGQQPATTESLQKLAQLSLSAGGGGGGPMGSANGQEAVAPPLPPKGFLKDKNQVARAALNRSPLAASLSRGHPMVSNGQSQHLAQQQQQQTMTNNRL